MANIKSAKKRISVIEHKTLVNRRIKNSLKAALGNHKVIKTFIEETGDSDLLWTLSRKDLHDVTAEVLNDHHANVPQKAEYLSDQLFNRFDVSKRNKNIWITHIYNHPNRL